ncbi:MAG: acyl carrier protein [Actinobacteria bacterium]|nr:acyl carrier protein [Actinomycetota bacterium]
MTQLSAALVVDAVNEVLGVKRQRFEPVEARTPLADLQLDSLDVAELFMAIEDHSGCELDPESARSFETVGDLAELRPAAPANDNDRGTTV